MLRRNSILPMLERRGRLARLAIVVLGATATSGCQEYLDRRDTVTLGVADATETNKAVHTITRWPRASQEDRWISDGERGRTAVARYRANKVVPPKPLTAKSGTGNDATPVPDVPEPPQAPAEK